MRYSDEFRASLVALLHAEGWPEQKGALARVAAEGGIPSNTLKRWATGQNNPPPDHSVAEKKLDLAQAIRSELSSIFDRLSLKRTDADYRALITAVGILIDKLQLIEGKPTERTAHEFEFTDEQRTERIATLLDAARARRDGLAIGNGEDSGMDAPTRSADGGLLQ